MRLQVAASVLLVSAIGGPATAGADEPNSPPEQCRRPLPSAAAPFGQPWFPVNGTTQTVVPVVPERDRDSARARHLREAAAHLQAAGLGSLADHVRGLSAARPAAESPQEADRWRPHEAATSVLLAIKLVEIDEDKLAGFAFDPAQLPLGGATPEKPFSRGQPSLKVVGPEANLRGIVEALRKAGHARVLSEPTIVTLAGRPASFRVGGEIPLWALDPEGKPILRGERYGTAVDFLPQLGSSGNLRLHLRCEFSEVDRTQTVLVAGKQNPVILRTCIDTPWEMKPGQTLIAARHGGADDRDRAEGPRAPAIVLLVTPELIEATTARPSPDRAERR